MQQNSKKLALGYLAQTQALLPKVGIDDHPGDGGPDLGKLTRADVAELYAKIIDIQNTLGQSAVAKATFEKAKTLIMVGKEAHQGVVALLLKRSPSKAEAVALFKKYATDGYLIVKLPALLEKSERDPLVKDALRLTDAQDLSLWQRGAQYLDIARVVGLAGEKLVFEALTAMAPKLLEQGFAGPLVLCEAGVRGMEIDKAAVEKALRAAGGEAPGYVALGLLWLSKKDDALAILAKLTDKSNVGQFPLALVDALGVDAFIALLKRTKNSTVGYKSAVDPDFLNRESDVRLKLMQATSAMEPQAISARDWHRLLEFAYGPEIAVVHAGIRKALRRDLPEQEKYWKQRPAPGQGELSARQAEWKEIVVVAAQAEPALALKYLAKITEPRRKVGALLALALAEALKSQPKGDLG